MATTSALTAVENKIPDISSLVEKANYNAKFSETEKKITDHNHEKYITTSEFNNLAAKTFTARLAQAKLVTKTNFEKINSNKTKHLIVENELKKLKTFDLSFF